ncbi:type I 3-dehydroquinate dehydratase, partial [Salmonella enterica subsp. enterica serovar Anatum]|nr:type I 3-dehydroquinate dehydratase [Salmonella enterica subsp. enterica serovar Anatum]
GVISRLAGEVFGSAATFGAVKKASAPGQISVADLRTVLTILHCEWLISRNLIIPWLNMALPA